VKLSSKDRAVIEKVNSIKERYMKNCPKIFMKKLIEELAGDEEEESFMRTFWMVFIGTILCPATSDTVDWRYLFSLTEVETMKSIDWCSLCLQCIVNEVGKFLKKLSSLPNRVLDKDMYVGG